MPASGFFRDLPPARDPRASARHEHERFLLDTYADRRAEERRPRRSLGERVRAAVVAFVSH